MDLLEWFDRGGVLMWAILAVSITSLAVFLERMWSLQPSRVVPRDLIDKIREKVAEGKADDAILLCEQSRAHVARVFLPVLRHRDDALPVVKEAVEDAGRQEAARLERWVAVLGVSASISPLLGLLGTVTGMIRVFQRVAETGVGNPLDMAAGIWEALTTTAFGLAVGIPVLIAHRFALSRVDRRVLALEEEALALLDLARAEDADDD
jgi:biopolymer transport protein ExbB